MFGIVLSALYSLSGFIFRSVIVKFTVYFALYFITTEFVQIISTLLPSSSNLNSAFAGIPSGVWYFLDLFAFSQGLPIVLSAIATRFIIRRIPVIG
jgi:Protein of unknown function (DUF2523)